MSWEEKIRGSTGRREDCLVNFGYKWTNWSKQITFAPIATSLLISIHHWIAAWNLTGKCTKSASRHRRQWPPLTYPNAINISTRLNPPRAQLALNGRINDGQVPGLPRWQNLRRHLRSKLLHLGASLQQTAEKILRHRGTNLHAHPATTLPHLQKIANPALIIAVSPYFPMIILKFMY